jgi:hypothetical protein
MQGPKTAKPATARAVNGLRDFEQLGGQLNPINSELQSAAQPASRILVTIPRGPHAIDRVTEQVINGQRIYDLRRFRPFGVGMWRPTPSGLTLRPDAALAVALAILEDLGVEVST